MTQGGWKPHSWDTIHTTSLWDFLNIFLLLLLLEQTRWCATPLSKTTVWCLFFCFGKGIRIDDVVDHHRSKRIHRLDKTRSQQQQQQLTTHELNNSSSMAEREKRENQTGLRRIVLEQLCSWLATFRSNFDWSSYVQDSIVIASVLLHFIMDQQHRSSDRIDKGITTHTHTHTRPASFILFHHSGEKKKKLSSSLQKSWSRKSGVKEKWWISIRRLNKHWVAESAVASRYSHVQHVH